MVCINNAGHDYFVAKSLSSSPPLPPLFLIAVIDAHTEMVVGRPSFYSYAFAKERDPAEPSLIGMKVPAVHEALQKACATHAQSELPWLTSVGWDAMITDEGVLFFEGNVGTMRTPRYMFMLGSKTIDAWMREYGVAPRTDRIKKSKAA